MGTAALVIVLGVISTAVAHQVEDETLSVYQIHDIDFENTNIEKLCLIAQFNATIQIFYASQDGTTNYTIPIPQDASTEGSFCNYDYMSGLTMRFEDGRIDMEFFRNTRPLSVPDKTTYCDHCDYGTWNMTKLHTILEVGDYEIHASVTPELLKASAPELTNGIDIKRAFKCEENDRITRIPLRVSKVLNSTSYQTTEAKNWTVIVVFYVIQLQPFLVFTEHFNDPYLCRDITVSLLLIILLPLIYFTIFILFYHIKAKYGCPPKCSNSGNERLKSSTDSDTCLEEDSTNMISGFSSIPMGLHATNSAYC